MNTVTRAFLIFLLFLVMAVVPIVTYRASYAHRKRLRVVTEGRVYRSGQMTANGFADAVKQYNIRTVINLQDEYPNPELPQSYFNRQTIREKELCEQLGVKYVHLSPDLLHPPQVPPSRPQVIDDFLKVMDDESNYPVLVHCRAGLHRTGCLIAVYRMTYENWSVDSAYAELKAHGFGNRACTSANEYVRQYVLTYDPNQKRNVQPTSVKSGKSTQTCPCDEQ